MNHKKLFISFLVLFLFVGFSLKAFAFNDTGGHLNEDAIEYLYDEGVVEGYGGGDYAPDNTINRAEFTKILIEAAYPDEASGSYCFDDVGSDWYAKYVCYAKELGIVEGYGDGTFGPANDINLAEALKIVLETYDFDVCESCYSVWYEPYYSLAGVNDLMDWVDLDVAHEITRGEMAQLIYNVRDYLGELDDEEPIDEEDLICEYDGETYEDGEEIEYSDCTTCTCVDGEITYCTGECGDEEEELVCYLSDEEETYFYGYADDVDPDFSIDYEYEVLSEDYCAGYAEYHYGDEEEDEVEGEELTFAEGGDVDEIPNVAILEFAADDECRYSNGNVRGECVVEGFYENHDDEYDMIMVIDAGDYEGKYNGWSGNNVHRYMPANLGFVEECGTTCQSEYPERLRYMQQAGDSWRSSVLWDTMFVHELGHYWGVDWTSDVGDVCHDESLIEYGFENGHWTQLFQAGEGSIMAYPYYDDERNRVEGLSTGILSDNGDGTFSYLRQVYSDHLDSRFNYMDLYAMGFIDEDELAEHEMYVVFDPVYLEDGLYSGTRYDLTLEDFQNLLLEKEVCEETGSNYYYTGDGSRQLHEYDDGVELAESFNVAIVLIKFPEQEIEMQEAYEICDKVNYDWIDSWNVATHGLSEISTHLTGDEVSPNCAALYAE